MNGLQDAFNRPRQVRADLMEPYMAAPVEKTTDRIKRVESMIRQRDIAIANLSAAAASQEAKSHAASGFNQHFLALQVKLDQDHQDALRDRVALVKSQVAMHTSKLQRDINAVPRFRDGTNADIVADLRLTAENNIDMITQQFEREITDIDTLYERKEQDLLSSGNSLIELMNSDSGANKVSTRGTSMYVRNYINFGGIDDAPPVASYAIQLNSVSRPRALTHPADRPSNKTAPVHHVVIW